MFCILVKQYSNEKPLGYFERHIPWRLRVSALEPDGLGSNLRSAPVAHNLG